MSGTNTALSCRPWILPDMRPSAHNWSISAITKNKLQEIILHLRNYKQIDKVSKLTAGFKVLIQ